MKARSPRGEYNKRRQEIYRQSLAAEKEITSLVRLLSILLNRGSVTGGANSAACSISNMREAQFGVLAARRAVATALEHSDLQPAPNGGAPVRVSSLLGPSSQRLKPSVDIAACLFALRRTPCPTAPGIWFKQASTPPSAIRLDVQGPNAYVHVRANGLQLIDRRWTFGLGPSARRTSALTGDTAGSRGAVRRPAECSLFQPSCPRRNRLPCVMISDAGKS